ncbi:aminoglycoside phosphotransferase/kinase family protein [Kineosporia babensis]|uniref:Phosphotransferase n=1 Tax=Kineosporia babensis TaxID=499548 RepID=A0A9X1SYG2_9ACTN|nr:phosphotransferase [Kineosporia babensis]MCD5317081.1 phosphotransferase [Kineosporia babensis]
MLGSHEATMQWSVPGLLGGAALAEVLGHPVDENATGLEVVPYEFGSPATGCLLRARGRRPDGHEWTAFVKVLQHVRHWPMLQFMPPHLAADFVEIFPWREELTLWDTQTTSHLPPGLRPPHLYRIVELGDDRVAVWCEDVDFEDDPWNDGRFARAADLLGQFGARRCHPDVTSPYPPDFAMQKWVQSLPIRALGPLQDDTVWGHPLLADHADLRAELLAAAPLIPQVMARFATLRHGLPHGDASPQNLLVPRDGSADFVVIDLSFQTPAPLGTDLSQLVVGLAHAGQLPVERLPSVEAAVLSGYRAGLAGTDLPPGDDDIEYAYAGNLLLRSGFTAIPYERLADPEAGPLIRERIALTRFILGSARAHLS